MCLAAALETVRLLESEYVANAAKIGAYLKPRLQQFMNVHRVVGDVRGLGLMLGIDIVKDRATQGNETPSCATRSSSNASSAALLVLGAGASTIRLSPPLLIDEEQADCAAAHSFRKHFGCYGISHVSSGLVAAAYSIRPPF